MATQIPNIERDAEQSPRGGITPRAIGLGLLLVVLLDVIAVYVRFYYHGSRMVLSHIPMAMLIVFITMLISWQWWADLRDSHFNPGNGTPFCRWASWVQPCRSGAVRAF